MDNATVQPASAAAEVGAKFSAERAIGPEAFGTIADAINASTEALAEVAGTGVDRSFRPLRRSEASEISGVSKDRVSRWKRDNPMMLASYREAKARGAEEMMQHPMTLAEMHAMMADLGTLPRRPEGCRAMRLGTFSFKGGVGKSTITFNLSSYLAVKGWRVLVVDADPQGSLSTMFGFQPEDVDSSLSLEPALASVRDGSTRDAILSPSPTHVDSLDILPASLDMIGADFEIAAAFSSRGEASRGFYNCVSNGLRSVEDRYDIILIDSAPAFSFSTIATMWASDGMIIPVPPSAPDYKATAAFCGMAGDGLGRLCEISGVVGRQWAPVMFVHNKAKVRSQSSEIIQQMAVETLGRYRCPYTISDLSAVQNSLNLQMSLFEATGAEVGNRGLRQARSEYVDVAECLMSAVEAAWAAGFARESASGEERAA